MSSNPPINSRSDPGVTWLWVFWLALSLLLAQSLGQVHAVKHGGLMAVAHAAGKHEVYEALGAHHGVNNDGFLDLLFSTHGSTSDCQLYDHLSHGQATLFILGVPLPIVSPSLLVAIFAGDALASWAALFDARGPPLTV